MKVVCSSFPEFQVNVAEAVKKGGRLFESTVRILNDISQRSEAVEKVLSVLTAVVITKDGDRYLLELINDCGCNYFDGQDLKGTAAFDEHRKMISEWAYTQKLYLLPGRIEL